MIESQIFNIATLNAHIDALKEEVATLRRLWTADCDDIDRLLERIGLGDKAAIAQEYRSEGGFLRGGKIENAIRERLAGNRATLVEAIRELHPSTGCDPYEPCRLCKLAEYT